MYLYIYTSGGISQLLCRNTSPHSSTQHHQKQKESLTVTVSPRWDKICSFQCLHFSPRVLKARIYQRRIVKHSVDAEDSRERRLGGRRAGERAGGRVRRELKKKDYDNFLKRGIMITAAISFFPPFLTHSNYFWKAVFFLLASLWLLSALFSFHQMPWSQNKTQMQPQERGKLFQLCLCRLQADI